MGVGGVLISSDRRLFDLVPCFNLPTHLTLTGADDEVVCDNTVDSSLHRV